MTHDTIAPQADTTLTALAVLEQYSGAKGADLDALLNTTNHRELVTGLLDLSQTLAGMLARAAETNIPGVIEHLRSTVVDMVNTGELGSGPQRIS